MMLERQNKELKAKLEELENSNRAKAKAAIGNNNIFTYHTLHYLIVLSLFPLIQVCSKLKHSFFPIYYSLSSNLLCIYPSNIKISIIYPSNITLSI